MTAARPRLVLIDGYYTIYRAFFARTNLSTSRGQPTNAVYIFVQTLRKILREQQPELIAVALDAGEPSARSELFGEYKANRAPMPGDLVAQLPWIRQIIAAYRIPVLEEPRYEADDVLGTFACRAADAGYDVVLVSSDKDLMQLVRPGVAFLHVLKEKLYGPQEVEADYGVTPERVPDLLALLGDTVDNIPGVPGVGRVGAKKLIQQFGSIEELLARVDEAPPKYREALRANAGQLALSKKLTTLHCDLPIPFEPEKLRAAPPDPVALRRLFTELEFFSLADELEPTRAADGAELTPAAELETVAAWRAAAAALSGEVHVAVLGGERPIGLAAGGVEGEAFYVDFRRGGGLREAAVETLAGWAADHETTLAGHDLKEVLRLCADGRFCRAPLFDAMLASYLLKPSVHGHTLEELALERLNRKPLSPKDVGWDKGQEPPLGDSRLAAFAGERIDLSRRLVPAMREELAAGGPLGAIYREIEAPLLPVLLGMEERGILLDTDLLAEMSRELGHELQTLEAEAYRLAGEPFNLNSPQQLGVILFEKLGYPVLKRTQKTRSYSTGAETLEELAARGYPLPEVLLRFREIAKLKGTYIDAFPALVDGDRRLHTRYYQAVAATGRLSSANPNLQNIPIRTELGHRIRKAFVAGPGHLLLVADYSQIELRILAHIAQEEALIDAFAAGVDIHRATAATVFGGAPELVTPEQRRAAKTINFGILYGMSAFGLAQNLGIPQKEADRFIKEYLAQYPGVRRYLDETLAYAEREGRVETLYGRVRYLPEIQSANRALRESGRRMAINARVQGTAADLLKKAMVAVDCRLRDAWPEARLLLTVHDELVFEVPETEVEAVAAAVREEMESVASLSVPLVVDAGWGRSWYEAKS
ncbi:MAG TPA: DNA polymerase I [Thermoanaerobaculia bacterium]|nr:DNA polymerase I [Thermoanaerobaculia bacterium]